MNDLRLHVGCGWNRRDDMINCDLNKTDAVDVVFDVQRVWPFDDNSAAEILSTHMLEHLDDPFAFFREAWRVLRPHGRLILQLPHGASDQAWSDITHRRAWFPVSFAAFQPGYGQAIGNPQHDWNAPFSVDSVMMRVHRDLFWLLYWPWRRLGLRLLPILWGGYVEIFVQMTALKTPAQIALFNEHGRSNFVPAAVVAWEHEWNPSYRGPQALKTFTSGAYQTTRGQHATEERENAHVR